MATGGWLQLRGRKNELNQEKIFCLMGMCVFSSSLLSLPQVIRRRRRKTTPCKILSRIIFFFFLLLNSKRPRSAGRASALECKCLFFPGARNILIVLYMRIYLFNLQFYFQSKETSLFNDNIKCSLLITIDSKRLENVFKCLPLLVRFRRYVSSRAKL